MKLHIAPHEVILMAAKRRAGVVIDVVLDEGDGVIDLHLHERLLQDNVAGTFVSHRVAHGPALG